MAPGLHPNISWKSLEREQNPEDLEGHFTLFQHTALVPFPHFYTALYQSSAKRLCPLLTFYLLSSPSHHCSPVPVWLA